MCVIEAPTYQNPGDMWESKRWLLITASFGNLRQYVLHPNVVITAVSWLTSISLDQYWHSLYSAGGFVTVDLNTQDGFMISLGMLFMKHSPAFLFSLRMEAHDYRAFQQTQLELRADLQWTNQAIFKLSSLRETWDDIRDDLL